MPFVSGFLRTRRGGGEIDNTLPPGSGGEIDNALPGDGGGWIDNTLPAPPGIWPPPVSIWPPIQLPPDYPMPPGSIWPPVHPPVAGQPLPGGPGRPDAGLPAPQPPQPPTVGGGPVIPSHKFLVAIVALSAAGPKVIGYTVVDPSLRPDHGLPGGPPVAQPK
jgi:hypothetical protein